MKRILLCLGALAILVAGVQAQDAAAKKAAKEYEALIARCAKVQSLTATVKTTFGTQNDSYEVKLKRPNLFRVENAQYLMASDGTSQWQFMKRQKQYMKSSAPKELPLMELFSLEPANKVTVVRAYNATFEGAKCRAIDLKGKSYPEGKATVYVNPKTGMPAGYVAPAKNGAMKTVIAALKTNPTFSAEEFAWTPPSDAKEYEQPNYDEKLLKVGTQAPDFTLPSPSGGTVSLKDQLGKGKAIILNFWFYG